MAWTHQPVVLNSNFISPRHPVIPPEKMFRVCFWDYNTFLGGGPGCIGFMNAFFELPSNHAHRDHKLCFGGVYSHVAICCQWHWHCHPVHLKLRNVLSITAFLMFILTYSVQVYASYFFVSGLDHQVVFKHLGVDGGEIFQRKLHSILVFARMCLLDSWLQYGYKSVCKTLTFQLILLNNFKQGILRIIYFIATRTIGQTYCWWKKSCTRISEPSTVVQCSGWFVSCALLLRMGEEGRNFEFCSAFSTFLLLVTGQIHEIPSFFYGWPVNI